MTYRNSIVPVVVTQGSNRQKYDGDAAFKILAMAEDGKWPEEWCVELGISMRTLYSWANERPEFEEAVEAAWHVLHAYWARLLRTNLTNPALRQNAILQVMAKRFPSTWGNAPRNTLDHFLARNSGESEKAQAHASTSGAPEGAITREEVHERIRISKSASRSANEIGWQTGESWRREGLKHALIRSDRQRLRKAGSTTNTMTDTTDVIAGVSHQTASRQSATLQLDSIII